MIAYPPALFFGDSWDYIVAAFSGHPVAISSNRPSVYGWLIRLFTLPSRDFVQLVGFQHLAGLLTGTLVYVLLLRARIPGRARPRSSGSCSRPRRSSARAGCS